MKSLIYGYGETGKSFERYLNKNNEDFEIFDSNISKYNNNLNLKNFDKILCSPGIPRATFVALWQEIVCVRERGIVVSVIPCQEASNKARIA